MGKNTNDNGSVRLRGSKWYYSFEVAKIGGKRKRIERVCKNATTERQAIMEMLKEKEKYENGGSVDKSITELSVSDFAEMWLNNYVSTNLMPATASTYRYQVKIFIKHYGKYQLKNITSLSIQEFVKTLKEENYADRTMRDIIKVLHSMFSYAKDIAKIITNNPCDKIKIPKAIVKKANANRVYNTEELQTIFDTLKQDNYFYYIITLIAYRCGMREGEILGLQVDNVDLKNGLIYVKKALQYVDRQYILKSPKNETSERCIAIDDMLLHELREYSRFRVTNKLKYGNEYKRYYLDSNSKVVEDVTSEPLDFFICRECGSYIGKSSLISYMHDYCKKKGVQFTIHSLRHCHATELIENGVPVKMVQARLGHKSITTTLDIYAEATKKMEEQALDVLNNKKLPTRMSANI